jgi:acetyl esterase/lipase
LAPEHRYPSPVEDIVRAYEYLTRHLNVEPYKIITIGDSAGAALILEMLFITHDPSMFEIVTEDTDDDNSTQPVLEELPRPAGSVMISPLVTDETTSESWKENVKYDFVSQYTAKVIKKDYFEPLDPDTPPDAIRVLGIAKLTTGFTAFLPKHCLFYVGDKEVLRDDALDVANKARDDGVDVETVMEDCVHDWFCVREVVKDKKILERADDKLADFIELSVREAREEYEANIKNAAYDPGLESVLEVDEDIPEISLEAKENDSGANGHHNMALAA